MALNFPYRSRSFDKAKSRVRFWGYDGAKEISFFLETEALLRFSPPRGGAEAGILVAFDGGLEQIHAAADRAYARGRKGTYAFTLTAADF